MLVADAMLVGYWSQVQGAQLSQSTGGVVFPCDAQLPDLQVAVGDTMVTIPGSLMNFSNVGVDNASGVNCE